MEINFDVSQVLQDRLASSLGLNKYKMIMDKVNVVDVSSDIVFQRVYNGFYIVRRNVEWRKVYYNFFESMKNKEPTFESIITYLYEHTGNVEPSFSSKMLATLLPTKPIWDHYVLQNLGLEHKGKTPEEKLSNAVKLYTDIEEWYDEFLDTPKAKECIETFDTTLPNYKDITKIKKVDTILWSIR